jgi:hypothetical protein
MYFKNSCVKTIASKTLAFIHKYYNYILLLMTISIFYFTQEYILSLLKNITISLICIVILYLCLSRLKLFIKNKVSNLDDKSNPEKPNNKATCVFLEGVWGEGKTEYYKRHLKRVYIKENGVPPIYISCFGMNKIELITAISSQSSFILNIFALNTLFARFLPNNWQYLMPRNKVIIFDDIERLHHSNNDYLDLLAIIEYLKNTCGCELLLIGNQKEIESPFFNAYLEKVVDEIKLVPKKDMKEIQIIVSQDHKEDPYLLKLMWDLYKNGCKNIRMIRTFYISLIKNEKYASFKNSNISKFKKEVMSKSIETDFFHFIKLRRISFANRKLFDDCLDYRHLHYIYKDMKDRENSTDSQRDTECEDELSKRLALYQIHLNQFAQYVIEICGLLDPVMYGISYGIDEYLEDIKNDIITGNPNHLFNTLVDASP